MLLVVITGSQFALKRPVTWTLICRTTRALLFFKSACPIASGPNLAKIQAIGPWITSNSRVGTSHIYPHYSVSQECRRSERIKSKRGPTSSPPRLRITIYCVVKLRRQWYFKVQKSRQEAAGASRTNNASRSEMKSNTRCCVLSCLLFALIESPQAPRTDVIAIVLTSSVGT